MDIQDIEKKKRFLIGQFSAKIQAYAKHHNFTVTKPHMKNAEDTMTLNLSMKNSIIQVALDKLTGDVYCQASYFDEKDEHVMDDLLEVLTPVLGKPTVVYKLLLDENEKVANSIAEWITPERKLARVDEIRHGEIDVYYHRISSIRDFTENVDERV